MSEMCCTWLAGNAGPKKSPKNAPSGHHRKHLSDDIFAVKECIDYGKNFLNSNTSCTFPDSTVNFGALAVEIRFASLGHPCKFQRVSHLGSVTARHSGSGRQPNFAALNRGRHLYSAGRPSRWVLAHISSS